MIIMCDIDNILNNLTFKTLELYNHRSGKNIQLSDITTYNFSECLSPEDANAICSLFEEKELWNSLSPIVDSQWGIETLINMGHRVVFATSTHECNFEWKCRWMEQYFPLVNINDIIRIHDKSLIRADIIIDDCMDNLTNSCCERICLDYSWNRNERKDYTYGIFRAYNWKEIIEFVNKIERNYQKWNNQ